MIIWIDGTYGVGKTTVAKQLKKKWGSETELLEADEYINETIKKIVEEAKASHTTPNIGGNIPQNNMRFLKDFKKIIEEKYEVKNKRLIVDMALTEIECKENLFDLLRMEGKNIVHFILTAHEKILRERIKQDKDRMKELALDELEANIQFLKDSCPDAIWIQTDNGYVDDIAEEIIEIIKLMEH